MVILILHYRGAEWGQQPAIAGFPGAQFDSFAALEDKFGPGLANRECFHVS
jgi:hypothetical protein